MSRKLHSPRMAPARQILALLALLGAAFVLLACGNSGEPELEGEPFSTQESADLTGALTALQTAFDDGDCDEAESKLAQLQQAVEDMPEERDAELRDALTSALDDLEVQIGEECQQADDSTSTSSATTEDVAPTTTEPEPTTSSTTSTTSTSSSEEEEPEPPTPPEEPPPTTPPGGGGDDGSGGTAPGFEAGRKAKPEKESKPGKGPNPDKGSKVKQR